MKHSRTASSGMFSDSRMSPKWLLLLLPPDLLDFRLEDPSSLESEESFLVISLSLPESTDSVSKHSPVRGSKARSKDFFGSGEPSKPSNTARVWVLTTGGVE